MPDIYHQFGGDLSFGPTGDFLVVSGDTLTKQRILRRLLTAAGDYIWNLQYGAGLGRMIGTPAVAAVIKNIIFSQIFQEATVARVPAPTVTTQVAASGTVTANIQYYDATTGAGTTLNFTV